MDWFYAQNNQQLGPVTLEALVSMFQQGHLQPGDLVWREGMPNWLAAASVPELSSVVPAAVPGLEYLNPLPGAISASGGHPIYAGFWLRFVATILDFVLIFATNFAIMVLIFAANDLTYNAPTNLIPTIGFTGLPLIISWLYFAFMESSQYQATLGKLALHLRVTDVHGERISFARATARFFGKFISYITFLIGFMLAAWTPQKQALHDLIAGCLVIRKR